MLQEHCNAIAMARITQSVHHAGGHTQIHQHSRSFQICPTLPDLNNVMPALGNCCHSNKPSLYACQATQMGNAAWPHPQASRCSMQHASSSFGCLAAIAGCALAKLWEWQGLQAQSSGLKLSVLPPPLRIPCPAGMKPDVLPVPLIIEPRVLGGLSAPASS